MWLERARLFVLLLVTLTAAVTASGQTSADVKAVTRELVCTCGCGNMIVANCNCSEADRVRSEVAALLAERLSRDAILEQYSERYGLEVLAAPPRRGFGLSAWILPFAAIGAALWFLTIRLRRWARRPPPTLDAGAPQAPERYAELLEREIRDA
ncbi:MAG: cytochrome c-type biogenesis protein CcmH [Acidobacteriota bacterium]